jgi:hypothetical protein
VLVERGSAITRAGSVSQSLPNGTKILSGPRADDAVGPCASGPESRCSDCKEISIHGGQGGNGRRFKTP